jgi:hypothetical protein
MNNCDSRNLNSSTRSLHLQKATECSCTLTKRKPWNVLAAAATIYESAYVTFCSLARNVRGCDCFLDNSWGLNKSSHLHDRQIEKPCCNIYQTFSRHVWSLWTIRSLLYPSGANVLQTYLWVIRVCVHLCVCVCVCACACACACACVCVWVCVARTRASDCSLSCMHVYMRVYLCAYRIRSGLQHSHSWESHDKQSRSQVASFSSLLLIKKALHQEDLLWGEIVATPPLKTIVELFLKHSVYFPLPVFIASNK